MATFDFNQLDRLLPEYYESEKGRLGKLLKQFASENGDIDYSDFYYSNPPTNLFLNGDLIREIRCPIYNKEISNFDKFYPDALILSNTCDISISKPRSTNIKEVIFAPAINLESYLKEYSIAEHQKRSFINLLKKQQFTNLFYLPNDSHGSEYVVRLDKIFWFPIEELNTFLKDTKNNRSLSLSKIGQYILITKITWHLARLPEEPDRYL